MQDDEDYEFVAMTSDGSRRAVISKSALHRLSPGSHTTDGALEQRHRQQLAQTVERKLAAHAYGPEEVIRIHGTDL